MSVWELEAIACGRAAGGRYGIRQGGPAGGDLAVAVDREVLGRFGIEYVVGGTHWPMYVPFEPDAVMRDYQRQNLFLATHPLVDIVAHPWWWRGHWQDASGQYTTHPWLGDFRVVPASCHDEFAAAVLEHGKIVEINLGGILLSPRYTDAFKRQYLDYLGELRCRGVRLSIGSDCHGEHYRVDFDLAADLLATVGITDADLWRYDRDGDG